MSVGYKGAADFFKDCLARPVQLKDALKAEPPPPRARRRPSATAWKCGGAEGRRARARAGWKNLMFSGTKLGLKELEDYNSNHDSKHMIVL